MENFIYEVNNQAIINNLFKDYYNYTSKINYISNKKLRHQFSINLFYIPMIFPFNSKNLIKSYFVARTIFICKKSY